MCTSLIKYLLVEDIETHKRKVVFDFPFDLQNRELFSIYVELNKAVNNKAIQALKFPYLERYFKKHPEYRFVDFVSVPCGKCPECLNANAKDWVYRIMKEAQQWDSNYFITLTYDDEHLPNPPFLVKDEISKFNKKLKVYLEREGLPSNFRFYAVGEYGSEGYRPHYHGIYFNLTIPDLKPFGKTQSGAVNYISDFIAKVWSKGLISIGEVDEASAAYVARYCEKKRDLTDEEKRKYNNFYDPLTGVMFQPEFSVMSRRPGIGADALDYVKKKVDNEDYSLFIKGHAYSVPMYYRKKIDNQRFKDYNKVKENIFLNNALNISDRVNYEQFKKEELEYRKRKKNNRL